MFCPCQLVGVISSKAHKHWTDKRGFGRLTVTAEPQNGRWSAVFPIAEPLVSQKPFACVFYPASPDLFMVLWVLNNRDPLQDLNLLVDVDIFECQFPASELALFIQSRRTVEAHNWSWKSEANFRSSPMLDRLVRLHCLSQSSANFWSNRSLSERAPIWPWTSSSFHSAWIGLRPLWRLFVTKARKACDLVYVWTTELFSLARISADGRRLGSGVMYSSWYVSHCTRSEVTLASPARMSLLIWLFAIKSFGC